MSRHPVALTTGRRSFAYWISKGRLVRREARADGLETPLEVVATDASDGAAVAAVRSAGKTPADVVVYTSRKATGSSATNDLTQWEPRLWVEGHASMAIAQEAASVSSVALVATGADRFVALTLDGRLAMSPLHAVTISLDKTGAPRVGRDAVAWVAGPVESLVRLTGLQLADGVVGLFPIYRDAQRFGLVAVDVATADASGRGQPSSVSWVDYPNGLDPAALASARICSRPLVAFVRPADREVGASHVLELAVVSRQGHGVVVGERRVMAVWERIHHVALGGGDKGGWLIYATDQGLRGRRLQCSMWAGE